MRRWTALGLTTGLWFAWAPLSASAHPHVWIEVRNAIVFNDAGHITGLRIDWTFDEFYSAWATEGLDTNKNGTLDPDELQVLATDNITNLKDYRFFTFADLAGTKVEYAPVTESEMTFKDGLLTLRFTLPFASTIDPRQSEFGFETFDPTFYIAMDLAGTNPIAFEGKTPDGCAFQVRPSAADPNGVFLPDALSLDPANANFGAQFAERIQIVCTKAS